MLDAISGAHIYGKNIIQAGALLKFVAYGMKTLPCTQKPLLDRNYLGINKLFFLPFRNPWMNRHPSDLGRHRTASSSSATRTWWEEEIFFRLSPVAGLCCNTVIRWLISPSLPMKKCRDVPFCGTVSFDASRYLWSRTGGKRRIRRWLMKVAHPCASCRCYPFGKHGPIRA